MHSSIEISLLNQLAPTPENANKMTRVTKRLALSHPPTLPELEAQAKLNTMWNWSPMLFSPDKTGKAPGVQYRHGKNFISANEMVLDFDTPKLNLAQAIERFKPYTHIIAPSRSHQKLKNGVVCDRFRVTLCLSSIITDIATYDATWLAQLSWNPEMDTACSDTARFYYKNRLPLSVGVGKLIDVVAPSLSIPVNEVPQPLATLAPVADYDGAITYLKAAALRSPKQAGEGCHKFTQTVCSFLATGFCIPLEEGMKLIHTHWNPSWWDEQREKDTRRMLANFIEKGGTTEHPMGWATAKNLLPAEKRKQVLMEEWANAWILSKNFSWDYKCQRLWADGKAVSNQTTLEEMSFAITRAEFDDFIHIVGRKDQHEYALKRFMREKDEEARADFKTRTMYDPASTDAEITKLLTIVTGQALPHEIAALKHFYLQVKRKAHGLKVFDHMMPIFYGAVGGTGKSELVRRMLAPIEEFYNDVADVSMLTDIRNSNMFERNYVGFLDEMSKASAADIAILKNKLSSSTIMFTPKYSNLQEVVANNMTCIGTSNKSIAEMIYDTSGTRRFWQIEWVQVESEEARLALFEKINAIDFLAIIRSVDERVESYIAPYMNEIREEQSKETHQDSLELFFSDPEQCHSLNAGVLTKASTVRNCYIRFCKDSNIPVYRIHSPVVLGKLLKKRLKHVRKEDGIYYEIDVTHSDNNLDAEMLNQQGYDFKLHKVIY